MKENNPIKKYKGIPAIWVAILVFVILACVSLACNLISTGDQGLQETTAALMVQGTMSAQSTQVAQQFEATAIAQQAAQLAQQAASLTQQALVATQPPPIPTSQSPAASPSPTEIQAIVITDWKEAGWTLTKSTQCHESGKSCWIGPNYKEKSSLTMKNSVLIDPSWPRPYLVFWTKYTVEQPYYFGYIEIEDENATSWKQVKTISQTRSEWHQDYVDLTDFVGTSIIVRFRNEMEERPGNLTYLWIKHTWYLEDLRIVTNYTPRP